MSSLKVKLLLKLCFDGKLFCGWQRQSQEHEQAHLISIQSLIEQSLQKLWDCKIPVQGCGRTDAGVHAEVFTAHFEIDQEHLRNFDHLDNLRGALNRLLPPQVQVRKLFQVAPDFHAMRSLVSKRYQYRVFLGEILPVHLVGRAYHFKCVSFDDAKVLKVLKKFEGEKDFAPFASSGYSVQTTVREIYTAQLTSEDYPRHCPQGRLVQFEFEGNGFLKQMVRNLVGCALQVARGKASVDDVDTLLLDSEKRKSEHRFPHFCAPAYALYLVQLNYPGFGDFDGV